MKQGMGIFLLTALLVASSGCGDSIPHLSGDCVQSPDQATSYFSPVHSFPLNVQVDSDFTTDQRGQIDAAAGTWNDFGQVHGVNQIFQTSVQDIPQSAKSGTTFDCKDLSTDDSFYLVRELSPDHARALGLDNFTPGVTFRCYSSQDRSTRGGFSGQIVLVQDTLVKDVQFTSVVLHELGHTLGLDHSCQRTGDSSSFIGCDELPQDHAYRQAVMFPSLNVPASDGTIEVKEQLQGNDENRAVCEYSQ